MVPDALEPDFRYSLVTLGTPRIIIGQSVVPVQPTAIVVLTYLALHPAGVLRSSLCTLLWPNRDPQRARHGLSQQLYALRQSLPGLSIEADLHSLRLLIGSIGCDVLELLEAHRSGAFSDVLRLHKGGFLAGLELKASAELSEWKDQVDHSVRIAVAESLESLRIQAEREHSWSELGNIARRQIDLGYITPVAYGSLLQSLRAQERNAECSQLESEAAELFGQHWTSPRPSHPLTTEPTEEEPEVRYVGRVSEFNRLRNHWERAASGVPTKVLVTGDAGIGKTRLAYQLKKLCILKGAVILDARCYKAGVRVAYAGLSDIATRILRTNCEQLPGWVEERLVRISGSSHDDPSGEGGSRLFASVDMIHAFEHALREVASRAPVLVSIDDCHWMDQPSADLFELVVARANSLRLMVLLCGRPARSKAFESLRGAADEEFQLAELKPAECTLLAERLSNALGYPVPQDCAEIVRMSAGNPLFLIELVRARLVSPRSAEPAPSGGALPQSIQRLVSDRYVALTSGARRIARAAAVVEAGAPDVVRKVAGLTNASFLRGIEELIALGFLHGGDSPTIGFRHDLLRETVYSQIPGKLRSLLHRRCAVVLRRARWKPAAVAEHARCGGLSTLAWRASLAAGDEAKTVAATSTALQWYKRAISTAENDVARAKAAHRILELCIAQSVSILEVAEYLPGLRSWYYAQADKRGLLRCDYAELHVDALRKEADPRTRAARLTAISVAARNLGDTTLALESTRDALSSAHFHASRQQLAPLIRATLQGLNGYSQDERVSVLAFAAVGLVSCSTYKEAEVVACEATRLAETTSDVRAIITAHAARACVYWAAGRLRDSEADFRRAVSMCESSGYVGPLGRIQVNYGVLLMDLGRQDEAKRTFDAHIRSRPAVAAFALANRAIVAVETGEFSEAMEFIQKGEQVAKDLGAEWLLGFWLSLRGLVALGVGDERAAAIEWAKLQPNLDQYLSVLSDPVHVAAFAGQMLMRENSIPTAFDLLSRVANEAASRNVLMAWRAWLELAELQLDLAPDSAFRLAQDVRSASASSGAVPLRERSERLLLHLQLRAR